MCMHPLLTGSRHARSRCRELRRWTIYAEHSPEVAGNQHGGVRGRADMYGQPLTDAGFVDLVQREYPWSHEYSSDGFTSMTSTRSDVLLLADDARAALLAAVARMIDDEFGGTITVAWETHTLFARVPG